MRSPKKDARNYVKSTEVSVNYQMLDELFESKGMMPEDYAEFREAESTVTYERILRWTRAAGVHGARPYIITAHHPLDTGKVLALRRAGWDVKAIADDLDTTVEEVREFLEKGVIRNGR